MLFQCRQMEGLWRRKPDVSKNKTLKHSTTRLLIDKGLRRLMQLHTELHNIFR